MAKIPFQITNVFNGLSASLNFAAKGEYHGGYGIDPDLPATDSDVRISGYLRPTAMEKATGSTIDDAPMWIVTNPKTDDIYVYGNAGKFYSLPSASNLTPTLIATLSAAAGNGADYYDNYVYLVKNTDIGRYGPLDGTPALTQDYWTATLSKAALSDVTYPTIRGIEIPNHPTHRHTDDKLYIGDVLSNTVPNTNKGTIHYIYSSKTTVEGDTNSASSYNALDLDYGYYPTAIETFGNLLAVASIEGVQTGTKQKPAAVTFWDTTSVSFQQIIQVEFPDPLITAMKNVNGVLYVWSGYATGGTRLSRFVGGFTFEELWFNETMYPPFQGAVDGEMNRAVWGGASTYPDAFAGVHARGSRAAALGNGIHPILKSTSAGANQLVTAVKYVETGTLNMRQPIVGWKDDTAAGIDKRSTTYGTSVFRSEVYRIGQPFQISELWIPFAQAIGANMTLEVRAYVDNASSSVLLGTINSTNFPNGERAVRLWESAQGFHDFFIELRWTGTALLTVALPINGIIETLEK